MSKFKVISYKIFVSGWRWLFYHLGILTVPYVQSFYLTVGAFYLFIPLMGRSGAFINSELVIGNLVTIIFSLLLSFTVRTSFQLDEN